MTKINFSEYFLINEKIDNVIFFQSLSRFFSATTVFVEGTSISEDLIKLFIENLEKGKFLPPSVISFPKSIKLRCKFSTEFMDALSEKAKIHAAPELFDYLYLYSGEKLLLSYEGVSDSQVLISKEIIDFNITEFINSIK